MRCCSRHANYIKDCEFKKIINYYYRDHRRWKYFVVYLKSSRKSTAEDIKHPVTGEVIIKKKKLIEESDCELIDAAGVKSINVYSVITCEAKKGVCQTCYGRDLARGKL